MMMGAASKVAQMAATLEMPMVAPPAMGRVVAGRVVGTATLRAGWMVLVAMPETETAAATMEAAILVVSMAAEVVGVQVELKVTAMVRREASAGTTMVVLKGWGADCWVEQMEASMAVSVGLVMAV